MSDHAQIPLPLFPRKTFIYPFPVVPAGCEEPS